MHRQGGDHIVTAQDVRDLLKAEHEDATLIVVEGSIKVVSGADARSGQYPGGLMVTSRDDLAVTAPGQDVDNLTDTDLEAVAARLTTAVNQLGG